MYFSRKPQKFVIFWKKMQEISALEANIGSFHQILVKYLPFSHTDISLMTKELTQIKVYTYFNIGDTKALVNLSQVTKLLIEIVAIAYSLSK